MIRIAFIAVWVALAASALAAVFHITLKVEQLEAQLHKLNHGIVREQEEKHVLQAEWSYLNRPQHLETLTREWLPKLMPVEAGQFVTFARLPIRGTSSIPAAGTPIASPARYISVSQSGETERKP